MRRWIFLTAGWLLFLIYAHPGFMSPDSYWQLEQARTGVYSDWHPPLMAVLWRYLDVVVPGPFLMLVLQSTLFLLGTDAILRRFFSPNRAALAASLILLFPPVLVSMAVIWKDAQMAAFLLAGIAALLSTKRRWRIAGCVLVFFATAVRYNALAATLPIIVLLFDWGLTSRWQRYVLSTLVWIAITFAAGFANRVATTHHDHPWHNSVALLDVAGTMRFSHITDDAQLRALADGVPLASQDDISRRLRRAYRPKQHWQLTHDEERIFDLPRFDQLEDVKQAWLRAVELQPRAFLYHRLRVFDALISHPTGVVYWNEPLSGIQRVCIDALNAIDRTFLFRPWMYLVLCLALLAICRARIPLALLLGGLSCELSLFIAAPSNDYRYSHWMIASTVIAATVIFSTRQNLARTLLLRIPWRPKVSRRRKSGTAG